MRRTVAYIVSIGLFGMAASAAAEPRTTAWVQDTHLEPAGETEGILLYEYQATDIVALEQGIDLVSLWLAGGVMPGLELMPQFTLRQRGPEAMRMHEVGLQVRGRVLGGETAPHLVVHGRYLNDLGNQHDHRLTGGVAGRLELSGFFLAGDLQLSTRFGGNGKDAAETLLSVGAGYGFLADRALTAGIETFVILPFSGPRISDPTFGEAGESLAFYYGPSLSLHLHPFWTALSATTGLLVSTPAAHILLRWMTGIEW